MLFHFSYILCFGKVAIHAFVGAVPNLGARSLAASRSAPLEVSQVCSETFPLNFFAMLLAHGFSRPFWCRV